MQIVIHFRLRLIRADLSKCFPHRRLHRNRQINVQHAGDQARRHARAFAVNLPQRIRAMIGLCRVRQRVKRGQSHDLRRRAVRIVEIAVLVVASCRCTANGAGYQRHMTCRVGSRQRQLIGMLSKKNYSLDLGSDVTSLFGTYHSADLSFQLNTVAPRCSADACQHQKCNGMKCSCNSNALIHAYPEQ